MVSLALRWMAILLAIAAAAVFCWVPALSVLHHASDLSATLPRARLQHLASMSVAAFPIGALGAWGLAGAPRPLRLCLCGLLVLALTGAVAGRAQVQSSTMAWAPTLASIVIVMLVLTDRLARLDPVLLDAIAASGASPWRRLWLVILPWILWPGLAAFLMCLAADAAFWLSAG